MASVIFARRSSRPAFAPELYYYGTDDVRREPRWAARLEDDRVRIVYLLSYYRDGGSTNGGCSETYHLQCEGHNGDSEHIALDVQYDSGSQHWLLKVALYSAHDGHNIYYPLSGNPYASVPYPSRLGGYPRAFVSIGKHANYASDGECDSGAIFNVDECESDTTARVSAGATLNVGSRAVRFIDCVTSSNIYHPNYGNNRAECYWTERNFQGWWTEPAGTLVTSYTSVLGEHGF
jgi:hypothetical protein